MHNKFVLKNKMRDGISFFNFFLNLNSFDLAFSAATANINLDNKFFFFNTFSHFNLGKSFCRPKYQRDLKSVFLYSLSFLDFINLHKSFLEETSTFNNSAAGI